jgi:hypothetical protein
MNTQANEPVSCWKPRDLQPLVICALIRAATHVLHWYMIDIMACNAFRLNFKTKARQRVLRKALRRDREIATDWLSIGRWISGILLNSCTCHRDTGRSSTVMRWEASFKMKRERLKIQEDSVIFVTQGKWQPFGNAFHFYGRTTGAVDVASFGSSPSRWGFHRFSHVFFPSSILNHFCIIFSHYSQLPLWSHPISLWGFSTWDVQVARQDLIVPSRRKLKQAQHEGSCWRLKWYNYNNIYNYIIYIYTV